MSQFRMITFNCMYVYMGNLIKKGPLIADENKMMAENCEYIIFVHCFKEIAIPYTHTTGSNVYHDYTPFCDRST